MNKEPKIENLGNNTYIVKHLGWSVTIVLNKQRCRLQPITLHHENGFVEAPEEVAAHYYDVRNESYLRIGFTNCDGFYPGLEFGKFDLSEYSMVLFTQEGYKFQIDCKRII